MAVVKVPMFAGHEQSGGATVFSVAVQAASLLKVAVIVTFDPSAGMPLILHVCGLVKGVFIIVSYVVVPLSAVMVSVPVAGGKLNSILPVNSKVLVIPSQKPCWAVNKSMLQLQLGAI